MYYIDRGKGPAVVLLHSYLANAFMWTPQVQALETRYRVIVPDLWGHGSSGALPEGANDLTALSAHLRQLLDRLDLATFALAGQSVGGMLAGELALILPERVQGLVLMGTYLGPEPAAPQAYFLDLLDRVEASGIFSPALLEEVTALFFPSAASPATSSLKASFQKQLTLWPAPAIRESVVPIGRMIFQRRDLRPHLQALRPTGTLVMCGEHDTIRPPTESLAMARTIGCPYTEVPGAGHLANLEHPEFVTGTLVNFLSSLEGAPLTALA